MKKIASMMKFTNAELSDIPTVMDVYNDEISRRYNEVLRLTMEEYLGRKLDFELDKDRFKFKELPNSDTKELYADGNLIGKLRIEFGLSDMDFMQNKITGSITFTPVQTFFYTPPNSN